MDATTPKGLRTSFRKKKVIAPLHTGGPFAVTTDGRRLITCVNDEVILTDVETAEEICRFKGDTTSVTALAVTPSGTHLIVLTSSLFLRIYEIPSERPPEDSSTPTPVPWIRQVARAHDAPVHVLAVDPTSCYVASGSADGHVKVWDIHRGFVTHHFGGHGGVVSALLFHFQPSTSEKDAKSSDPTKKYKVMRLISGSVDSKVRIYSLKGSRTEPLAVLEGHMSVPRGFSVSSDGQRLITSGRDAVVLLWDLETSRPDEKLGKNNRHDFKLLTTIPVLERVEAAGIVELDGENSKALKVFTAGEKGVVRIWDLASQKVVMTFEGQGTAVEASEDMEEQRQIVSAIYIPKTATIATLHGDQNILFHSIQDRSLSRQFIGYNDEIIDAAFLSTTSRDSHLALATNSSLIRVYSTDSLDARLLSSHTDTVLCLDTAADGRILGSGGKDKSVRIWSAHPDWRCVAICDGHTESVGAIGFSRRETEGGHIRFLVTGSQDRTVKLWDMRSVLLEAAEDQEGLIRLKSLSTIIAHDKDINALDVSPNDQLLATGSQDKTAKIFSIEYSFKAKGGARGDLKLLATLSGHRRGVWTVRFSKYDRVVATGSGDKTIKLWSSETFACLKTFEGHTNSVLRVDFLNRGAQLVTAAADGLVKVWNAKDEECTATLDNHEEKVWAVAVSSDEKYIVSAAADSVVTFWEDVTELEQEEKQAEMAEIVLKEQDFINYVSVQDYRNAILLALSMDQPGRLFNLFQSIRPNRSATSSITGNPSVDTVIKTLPPLELARLLRHVRNWNANTKTHPVAQTILHAILKLRSAPDILKAFSSDQTVLTEITTNGDNFVPKRQDKDMRALKDLLDGLIPYTERHFARAERLMQDSYVVDYILSEMDSGILVGESDTMIVDSS